MTSRSKKLIQIFRSSMTWFWHRSNMTFCTTTWHVEMVIRRLSGYGRTLSCPFSLITISVEFVSITQHAHVINRTILSATAEKSLIRAAQNIIQKESCIKFTRIKSPDETNDYVHIMPGHGCASTVGYWGGKQIIYLQKVVKLEKQSWQTNFLLFDFRPQIQVLHAAGSDTSRVHSCFGFLPHAYLTKSR